MKHIITVLSVFAFLCVSTLARDPWEAIAKAVMAFPQQPSEKAFRAIESKMETVPRVGNSDSELHAGLLGAAFLAGASKQYGWTIAGKSRSVEQALEILSGKGRLANYMRDDNLVDDNKFDMWWMSYLGSQDDRYLFRLLKYAGSPEPKNDPGKAALIKVASWSFMSNCKQIKGVKEFAKRRLNDPAYKDKRTFLVACLVTAPL